MAGAPKYKVFDTKRDVDPYRVSGKEPEDIYPNVCQIGEGAEVRHGHSPKDVLWREGSEACEAAASVDEFAMTIYHRQYAARICRTEHRFLGYARYAGGGIERRYPLGDKGPVELWQDDRRVHCRALALFLETWGG